MIRWGGRLLGMLVLVLLVCFPMLRWGSGGDARGFDSARITDYAADFEVDDDGRLHATETLKVFFPGLKHGIFRFFDVRDPGDTHVRLEPKNLSVTRNGEPEEFDVQDVGHGRYRNVKIGSASTTITDQQVYVIKYTIDGVLAPSGQEAQFYWNLIPGGWQMPIDQSRLSVTLPEQPQDVKCAVGNGSTGGCTAAVDGTGFTVTTGELERHTPVTVKTAVDMVAPDRGRSLWPLRMDPVLGTSTGVLAALLLLAVIAGLVGEWLARGTRERKPQFPLMYAPPDGIGPAQAAYLYRERVNNDAFVASLMQTSELGATQLTRNDGGWKITDTKQKAAWQTLDPISEYAANKLGVRGGSFTASDSVKAGKKLDRAITGFQSEVASWAKSKKLVVRAGAGTRAGFLVIGGLALAIYLATFNPLGVSVVALVPGLFALFAIELLVPGSSTKRTAEGRELWSRIGGFRRMLATPSAEQRFDFSGRKELYTTYIPWAVAFGVADEWSQKYRLETGEEPPAPHYFASSAAGYTGGSIATSMADDFSATVDSAISAYEATQRSSSSGSGGGGGGGFSGGGGGGGGGGGSW